MYPNHLPLSSRLTEAHATSWQTIAGPGAFFTGRQRVEMVRVARTADDCDLCRERKLALSPMGINGEHDVDSELAPTIVDVLHRLKTDPGRLTRRWFEQVIASGLSLGQYVEIVSVVTAAIIIDTLHNALGLGVPALPRPITGKPTGEINNDAVDGGAWVPILSAPDVMADTGLPQVPNIARSLGLVPSALALFFGTFRPHYQLANIELSISQAQAEFVASRVSAINECFYWTTSHTMLLRASGQQQQQHYDLNAVTAEQGDGGVAYGDDLRTLTEHAVRSEWLELAAAKPDIEARLGLQRTTDALVVAAAFNGITRVADATGIPLDANTEQTTEALRAETGIADFAYDEKSARYDWSSQPRV